MIDINKPVKQGSDIVLNYKDGEPKLGSASGYEREVKRGKLFNLPPTDNPNGDTNPPDRYEVQGETGQPSVVVDKPARKKNGQFAKK